MVKSLENGIRNFPYQDLNVMKIKIGSYIMKIRKMISIHGKNEKNFRKFRNFRNIER